jgi:pilus assembly protein Flp/PilA
MLVAKKTRWLQQKLKRVHLFYDESGPTAVEYAVMLAVIIVVCVTAVQSIGTRAYSSFWNVTEVLH